MQLGAEFALALRPSARFASRSRPVTVPNPLFAFPGRDLFHRTAAGGRKRLLFQNVALPPAARLFVPAFDQQPILVAVAIASAHSHQVPAAVEFFAVEHEIEVPFCVALVRIAFSNPVAAVPDHHRTATVLTLRNGALERIVFDRMILDVHSKPFFARIEARPPRHGPALHHAIEFEAEIVMQPPRRVFLDHIAISDAVAFAAARLSGDAEFPFLTVKFEGHDASIRAGDLFRCQNDLGEKAHGTLAKCSMLHSFRRMLALNRIVTSGLSS